MNGPAEREPIVALPRAKCADTRSEQQSEVCGKVPFLTSGGDKLQAKHTFGVTWSPPRHAYPAPYPPICNYDPFPPVGSSMFRTPWARRATSGAICDRHCDTDVDDLALSFKNLSICDIVEQPTTSKQKLSESGNQCRNNNYGFGFTTVPPRAPLAALVRDSATVRPVGRPNELVLPTSSCLDAHTYQTSVDICPQYAVKSYAMPRRLGTGDSPTSSCHRDRPRSRASRLSTASRSSSMSSMASTDSNDSEIPETPSSTPPPDHADLPLSWLPNPHLKNQPPYLIAISPDIHSIALPL